MIDLSGIDAEDLINRLDLKNARLTSGGDEVNFSCFSGAHSHGDERPSAYMNVETKLWMCHGCHASGTAITLVMEVQQISRPLAERFLRETYGVQFDEPIGGSMSAETEARFRPGVAKPEQIKPPTSWLRGVHFDWASDSFGDPQHYLMDRGFSTGTLNDWGIGYDYTSDRLTIPIYSPDGELIGVKGRAWRADQQPKYLILGDTGGHTRYGFEPYEGSEVLFGLHRNREVRQVVLCEGELNALALAQLGVARPVANGMSYFSEHHARALMREAEEVILYYDLDNAGQQAVWGRKRADGSHDPGIAARLDPFMRVRIVTPGPEDPADLLQQSRGDEALELVDSAKTALELQLLLR
jgi:DNA primase